jgi:trk system potassium uptake protein TrkH
MRSQVIIRTLGVLFLLFSTTLLPPIGVAWYYRDGELTHFSVTFAIAVVLGLTFWLPLRRRRSVIHSTDGFAIVALMWTAISVLGAVPFMLGLDLSFADAFFESASGYTTTGATVIVGLDALSPSILFYRQELQWLGGIGVIVLAIALLPMLGIGGMQLYKAETPGPFKSEKLTPRITRTARNVSALYVALTAVCALSFWLAGMSAFDAIAHSLSTLSTGGYSTHDASIAYFDSFAIETVAVIFMLIGGISFGTHFAAWQALRLSPYFRDAQVRAFVGTVALLTIAIAVVLVDNGVADSAAQAFRLASFEVVSIITTTGFGIADFSMWPLALPVLLMFAGFIGGCAGSTSGGIKTIRLVVLAKQMSVHVQRLVHPQVVRRIKVDGHVVPESVIDSIWGFFAVYVLVFVVLMITVMMDGLDQITAFGAVATCINNVGPGLGEVASTFVNVPPMSKIVLAFAMLLGRLEIFTFLVLLSPTFWRR